MPPKARDLKQPATPKGGAAILSRATALLLATILLSVFVGLSFWEMTGDSLTIDERVYLPAGYVYWTQKDFSLNREHPPLAKLWAALPLLTMNLKLPPVAPSLDAAAYQMNVGSGFLFTQNLDRILFWGRLPMLLLGLLLAILVFWWSWELHGNAGAALVSLLLIGFEPSIIAHSHYVATDVALATFSVMAMFFLWRFTRGAAFYNLLLASSGLGLALASKFSAVFLVPVFFLLLLLKWPSGIATKDKQPVASLQRGRVLGSLWAMLIAAVFVQASYLFSTDLTLYFKGLFTVNTYALPQSVLTYIHGEFFPGGVWWYSFYVLLLKLTLPTIIVITVAAASLAKNREIPNNGLVFTLLPAAVYLAANCAFANNLGVRYLIPFLSFLLVFAGRAWFVFAKNRRNQMVGAVLSVWLLISLMRVSPHYISYFNELGGGPVNAPHYLDDSNIDWGQDLLRLMDYFRGRNIKEAVLGYWGPTPPEYYAGPDGIRWQSWTYRMAGSRNPPPGVYAISVNNLIAIRRETIWLNQPWNPNFDWLNRFQPSDRIGYSIYIYRFPQAPQR
jgi:4-amino-4-deoxy-L-arabinose transferase-like glycosyltransferase